MACLTRSASEPLDRVTVSRSHKLQNDTRDQLPHLFLSEFEGRTSLEFRVAQGKLKFQGFLEVFRSYIVHFCTIRPTRPPRLKGMRES